jgi:phosphoglycolate phosphatase
MLEDLLRSAGAPAGRSVMVGDMVIDLETAQAAGVGFVGVDWGYGPADALSAAGARRIASSADELRAVILHHFS